VLDEFPFAKVYFAVPVTYNPYHLYESAFKRDFFVIDLVENLSAFVTQNLCNNISHSGIIAGFHSNKFNIN